MRPTTALGPSRHIIVAVCLMVGVGSDVALGQSARVVATDAELRPIVDTVRLSGTVVAPRSARVSTAVGELVERIAVELGDEVGAGQTLVELDRALALHELAQAKAAVNEAEAELAEGHRRVRMGESLAQRGNMPQDELDSRRSQVRIAAAAVERLKAEAAGARENLRRHTILAPFAGVVAQKATEAGEWVSPGTTLVELVAIDDLRVDIPVPQKYYPQLRAETPIALQFDALPGQSFEARRIAMVPISDPTVRTFMLRVQPVGGAIPLMPGMSAQASLNLATGEQGIVISRDAVIRYPDGRTTVWVVEGTKDETTIAERHVQLGRAFDGFIQVRHGLEAGERVVETGNEALRSGQQVSLVDGSS